jgi:hypothetical protein
LTAICQEQNKLAGSARYPRRCQTGRLTEKTRILEDSDDGLVEVGEDDPGVGIPAPEAAYGRAEQQVVVPGHAVDVAQAADEVIVRRVGALPEGEDRRRAPRRWVSRHDDVYCSLVDEPLHVSLTDKSLLEYEERGTKKETWSCTDREQ